MEKEMDFKEIETLAGTKGVRTKKETMHFSVLPGMKSAFIRKCEVKGINPRDVLRAFVDSYVKPV